MHLWVASRNIYIYIYFTYLFKYGRNDENNEPRVILIEIVLKK